MAFRDTFFGNMAYNGLSQHVDFSRLPNPSERFELLDLIGEGTYGEVYSAKDKHTGRKYAVKILESIADNIEEIEEEYLVLRDLSKHPNIPDFAGLFLKRGTTVEDDQLWFVLELRSSARAPVDLVTVNFLPACLGGDRA
uniref:Protein kinase domain-containing protein n=1 Tax=Anopheles melas TaxID=34690 RepID=A0A182UFE3_9DIPT